MFEHWFEKIVLVIVIIGSVVAIYFVWCVLILIKQLIKIINNFKKSVNKLAEGFIKPPKVET